jgi:hypothetical protein
MTNDRKKEIKRICNSDKLAWPAPLLRETFGALNRSHDKIAAIENDLLELKKLADKSGSSEVAAFITLLLINWKGL